MPCEDETEVGSYHVFGVLAVERGEDGFANCAAPPLPPFRVERRGVQLGIRPLPHEVGERCRGEAETERARFSSSQD